MIEESYVGFETARMLKEAGFNCVCRKWYEWKDGEAAEQEADADCNWNMDKNCYSRPTQALAARWLRETHGIHVSSEIIVYPRHDRDSRKVTGPRITWGYLIIPLNRRDPWKGSLNEYKSYEEALETGLQEAIKLIKK